VIESGQVIWCAEHLSSVLLHSDLGLLVQLEDRLFGPLRELTPRQRERMLDTLRAWIEMQGNVPGMAELLGVHPQTVRYRMRQLESTFAERLQDPKLRFEMELVLRSGVDRCADEEPVRLPLPRGR
jgi:DNA-binding PucR family transcriptional regulator